MASIDIEHLNFYYGQKKALSDVNLLVPERKITALIGPSGCGKSTFLRCLNRMNDTIKGTRAEGSVRLDGQDIYTSHMDVVDLRRRVGMVFQRPNPFPQSVFDNVAFGPRVLGMSSKGEVADTVEESLRGADLWDEVKDGLDKDALSYSLGQQQRLCIARALAQQPDVLLLDEPCSGLDPISTLKIEDALRKLKEQYTIVLVSHNTQQAARAADRIAFLLMGELVEHGRADQVVTSPADTRTADYFQGRFG